MDVLSLDISQSTPFTGDPAGGRRVGIPRRWQGWIDAARGGRPGDNGEPVDASPAISRRAVLLGYTAAQILLGIGLVAIVTIAVPIWPGIASPTLDGTALAGTTGGVLLWTMFGLLGSVRTVSGTATSGHFTFHLPFVGAAMILGGPTAGAWVAILSTIERRELESQPWYGLVSNHMSIATAAIVGGATYALVEQLLLAATGDLGTARFIAVLVAGLVLEGVANALSAVTIMIRDQMSRAGGIGLLLDDFRRETVLEVSLIWVLVIATASVGWWAPMAVGVAVIALNPRHRDTIDQLTGFLPLAAFERRVERKVGWMRRGFLDGGAILSIGIDGLELIRDQFGQAVVDEAIVAIAARIREACPRREDLIGRLRPDEFAVFFAGLVLPDVGMRKAEQLITSIGRPISTVVGPVTVEASVGVHVEQAWGGVSSAAALIRRAEQAMHDAKDRREPGGTARLSSG